MIISCIIDFTNDSTTLSHLGSTALESLLASHISLSPLSSPSSSFSDNNLFYLSLFQLAIDAYTSVPLIFDRSHDVLLYCQLAINRRELVMVDELGRYSWAFVDDVHIYDVVS